jgi:cytochrome c oxidase assembly factor CtaG
MLSIVITEVAVYNVFIYIQLIAKFQYQSYLSYLSYLVSPFLFYMAAQVFTPDPGVNTKEYFVKRMTLFFSLFALLIASHFIYELSEAKYASIMRLVFIVLIIVVGFSHKPRLAYLVVFFWAISIFIRGSIVIG